MLFCGRPPYPENFINCAFCYADALQTEPATFRHPLSSSLSSVFDRIFHFLSLSLPVLSLDSRVSRTFKRLPSPFLFPFALARDFVAFNPEKVPPLFDPYLGARESFKPPSGPTFRYLMETWKLAFHRWNNKF